MKHWIFIGLFGLAGLLARPACAGPMNSATFTNDWNVLDAGGATRNSATYKMYDGLFQTGIGVSQAAVFGMGQAGFIQVFDSPTSSPTPTSSSTPTYSYTQTATQTVTPTDSDTQTATRSVTPTDSNTQTPTMSITATNSDTQTATLTVTPTDSHTQTVTLSFTPTFTLTITLVSTGSATSSQTITPTHSDTQTSTSTITPSFTPTITTTDSDTQTSTLTVTTTDSDTQTSTSSITPTFTSTITPTDSRTQTSTSSITPSFSSTATPSFTSTISTTQSDTQTSTSTITPSFSSTVTPTFTTTISTTSTDTQTSTSSVTPSFSSTSTSTVSPSRTDTPTSSATPSSTWTPTDSATSTSTSTVTPPSSATFTSSITTTYTQTPSPSLTGTPTPTRTITALLTSTDTPTASQTSTLTPTQTPQAPVLSGGVQTGSGTFVFSGTGQPGTTVFIVEQPGAVLLGSGTVASDGTFAIALPATINPGDGVEAHAGIAGGPVSNVQTAFVAPSTTPASGTNTLDAGASVLTVSGIPGQQVVVVDTSTAPDSVLGQAIVGANGQAAVFLSQSVPGGTVLELVVGGLVQDTVTVNATPGQAASLDPGFVFTEGNVLTGHGTPGDQVQLVDATGGVLGSTSVAADGTFSLPVSGAQTGTSLSLVQNGVKTDISLTPQKLGDTRVFISKNIFRPLQGGVLDIGFKAIADERVTVKIFNLAGELVRPVADMEAKAGVVYALSWDGKNAEGQGVAAGVYLISAHGGQTHILKKVIVLK